VEQRGPVSENISRAKRSKVGTEKERYFRGTRKNPFA